MAYSRSANSTLLGEPVHADNEAVYYHAFRRQDVVFGATRYCRFTKGGGAFFGKVHSCWRDRSSGVAMAEIQPFVYAGMDGRDFGDTWEYPELKMVVGDTIEIAISTINPVDVRLLHVPADIADADIADYVEENIGMSEYSEDEEDDGFVVKGDAWGWYSHTDDGRVAPPPQFVDKVMAYSRDNLDGDRWFQHEACYWILGTYMSGCAAETFDDFELLDNGGVPASMEPALAAQCTNFMHRLRAELAQPISVYDVYELCTGLDLD